MEIGEFVDEKWINIKSDPRLNISNKSIEESYESEKNIENMIKIVFEASNQLAKSLIITKDFEKLLSKEDTLKFKNEIKLNSEISKKIIKAQDLFFGKEDKRQGIIRSPNETVLSRIRKAYYYSVSRPNGLTKTEKILIKQAKDQLKSALDSVNILFERDWSKYKLEMEEINISPFKSVKKFNINY